MEKLLPFLIAAIVILLAVIIIIRHIIKMINGRNSCGSCSQDCSSCGIYKAGKNRDKDSDIRL